MREFLIVAIGSSAGGLDALQKLFNAMPPDSGIAFVVAAHLDPTHESHLSGLLGRCTEMPVIQIEQAVRVEPSRVYVIAPDQELTIRNGIVHTSKPEAPRGHRHPVDVFFRSLAEDQGERAVGIILSGTGTNGSLGLRFIKAEGGVAIAQDPETAAFQGMPRSAIGTGIVDLVLSPEAIPAALVDLARRPYMRRPADAVEEAVPETQLRTLLNLLLTRSKRNFSGYKKQTLLRRIYRRMGLHRIEELGSYVERLRTDAEEVQALSADLTINVTGFFRDPEAWVTLDEQVIAPLIEESSAGSMIRVWVPGCSTGEEAYSIAMLIAERADAAKKSYDLKLFATDVAPAALSSARAGAYPASIAQDLSAERLERWFDRQDDTYSVRKTLREAITFAPQSLLQDPPFSHLDLISCRNLLIYIEPDVQKRLIALFHFALRERGHQFLGSAETIAGQEDLFETVSTRWRIYRRLGSRRHDVVDFPLVGPGHASAEAAIAPAAARPRPRNSAGELTEKVLLEHYAPTSALIDRQFRVQFLHGPTEDYLRPPHGEPSYNLIAMAREGLQTPLRSAVRKAVDGGQEVMARAHVRRGGARHLVRIVVRPLRPERDPEGRLIVSFSECRGEDGRDAPAEIEDAAAGGVLQAELDAAREDLRLTVEQMETANEELKASNEEIRSINEELQAANEELETSKEELQSLNEELNTVNNQLQAKVDELEHRTDDLNNLLVSSDVATLFLDRNLCIRWFTPSMKALLELVPTDIGRPLSHFAQRFGGSDLIIDVQGVLERLQPVDAEVESDDHRWYIRHIAPYRTRLDQIAGVVVTFVDITERRRGEQQVQDAKMFAESIVDTVREPLLVLNSELRVQSANSSFYRAFGVRQEETTGQLIYDLGNRQWDIPDLRRLLSDVLPEDKHLSGFEVEHTFENIGRRTMLLNARQMDKMQLILLAIEDITERKRGEAERQLLVRELSHRVKNIFAVIQSLAMQTRAHVGSVESFRESFLGRLHALANAHSMLLLTDWRDAELRSLVEQAVAAYRADHPSVIEIEGEAVTITPRQGLGLSLVLHELGTNAAKYGALSRHEGRLRVSWRIESDDQGRRIRLRWHERHGPAVEAAREKGFGTRLIERACKYELQGNVELDYAPEGLTCDITFPL